MISGCMDIQTSADAWNINDSKKWSGALTTCLLEVLAEYEYNITCYRLNIEINKKLKEKDYKQVSQMTCSKKLEESTIFSAPNSYMVSKKRKREEPADDYEILGC
jgi:hypothetical protein